MNLRDRIKTFFNRRQSQPNKPKSPLAVYPGRHGGVVVTQDKALELSACYACVRAISEDIAKLPWNVYATENESKKKLVGNYLQRLLSVRPNPETSAFVFRETLISWALTWGNAYAEIERDLSGRPVALWLIEPWRVDVVRMNGELTYKIMNERSEAQYFSQNEIFHLRGLGDGLTGYSLVGLAAESIGFGIAAEQYGAGFFGNNTTPGLALKIPTALSDPAYERLKDQIAKKRGSKNAFSDLILEEGLDFARPNMSQVDAQYVETLQHVTETMCRWFRVPPHKVSDLSRAHFANIENNNIAYVVDTLTPWIVRLEQEADYKLISQRSQISYSKIAVQALLRGDTAARAQFYKDMFSIGAFSPNMILELEDMNPIGPEGDEHYIQSAMTTLKKVVEAEPPAAPTAPKPAGDDEDEDNAGVEMLENLAASLTDDVIRFALNAKHTSTTKKGYYTKAVNEANHKHDLILNRLKDWQPVLPKVDLEDAALFIATQFEQLMIDVYEGNPVSTRQIKNAIVSHIYGN